MAGSRHRLVPHHPIQNELRLVSSGRTQRGVVETFLASQKVTRDSRVVVPYFEAAPYMLVNTDLIFTTARHFAAHFAQVLPLVMVRLPLAFAPMRFYQLWHDRAQHDPAHVWLRSTLRGASQHLAKPRSVGAVGAHSAGAITVLDKVKDPLK